MLQPDSELYIIPAQGGPARRLRANTALMNSWHRTPYDSVRDVWLRTGLSPRVLERLADADAFGSLGLTRREALWAAKALGRVGDRDDDLPLFVVTSPRAFLSLPPPLASSSPPPLASSFFTSPLEGEVDQRRLAVTVTLL